MQLFRNTLAQIRVKQVRVKLVRRFIGVTSLLTLMPGIAFSANTSYKVQQVNPTGSTLTLAVALNNDGAIVGNYTDSSKAVHGFAFAGGKYTLVNFPKADKFTRANGINDTDFIVGDFIGEDGFFHGFTLSKGKYTQYDLNLGTLSTSIFAVNNAGDFAGTTGTEGFVNIGGTVTEFYGSGTDSTYPTAINNNQDVVGQFFDSSNNSHCFERTSTGTITEIVYPGALQTACTGINDSGLIYGWYENSSSQFYTFLDNAGVFTSLSFLTSGGINNAGSFVGNYTGPGPSGGQTYGFLASPHTMKSVGTVAITKAESTSLVSVNNAGDLVGQYTNAKGTSYGLLVVGSKLINIVDPKATAGTTWCYGVNSADTVVGFYGTSSNTTQGFMYSAGTYTDIGPAGALFSEAININDAGVIAGTYEDSSGVYHAFTYNGSTYTTIDVPGAVATEGWGINSAGDVTIDWEDANGLFESAVYNGTTFTTYDVPGAFQSLIHSINTAGNFVFTWYDLYGNDHAAFYESGSYYVFDDANGTSTRGDGINDSNLIVGRFLQAGSTTLYDGYKATN